MSNVTTEERVDGFTPQLKAKWVCALRSGEYEQGVGQLFHDDRYCCFGVLLKVAGHSEGEYAGHRTISAVRTMINRDIPDPYRATLENMNDGEGGQRKHSFTEIADFIEKNL